MNSSPTTKGGKKRISSIVKVSSKSALTEQHTHRATIVKHSVNTAHQTTPENSAKQLPLKKQLHNEFVHCISPVTQKKKKTMNLLQSFVLSGPGLGWRFVQWNQMGLAACCLPCTWCDAVMLPVRLGTVASSADFSCLPLQSFFFFFFLGGRAIHYMCSSENEQAWLLGCLGMTFLCCLFCSSQWPLL